MPQQRWLRSSSPAAGIDSTHRTPSRRQMPVVTRLLVDAGGPVGARGRQCRVSPHGTWPHCFSPLPTLQRTRIAAHGREVIGLAGAVHTYRSRPDVPEAEPATGADLATLEPRRVAERPAARVTAVEVGTPKRSSWVGRTPPIRRLASRRVGIVAGRRGGAKVRPLRRGQLARPRFRWPWAVGRRLEGSHASGPG